MSKRRVVVTGLGMLSPLGCSVDESWSNMLEGRSGITPITDFDASEFSVRIAGTVPEFDIGEYIPMKEARRMDGFIQFGLITGIQAMNDSGLEVTDENRHRIGVAVGSGIGGIATIEACHSIVLDRGPRRVSPFFVPSCVINMVAGHLSIMFGMQGPNIAITTACTTGAHNIGFAARMIAEGDVDAMLAGGAEKSMSPTTMAGFAAMKALSGRNDDPERASRPWDRDRDGFVLSDGSSVLVLEEYEHARARGAKIYCEIAGFGMSADASHMTSPSENGEGAAMSMRNALRNAEVHPADVDYINAHGTSTPLGDVAETMAIKSVMGDGAKSVAVSSTKSMIGHLLGASGSVEAGVCVKAIANQVAPPTINLENTDEQCDLDYVPGNAREMPINVVMSNSFGFGGTNGTLVFRKLD
ncbi:MAG: beta-ketoacyl-[acyl-carrier-protein] synthase II [Gammaproteobacteria bacterium]|uniref:3-oxoacyl-[acyl-carrier-protein] synthase 2 n=1 Tax=OM182 bacterium MED-G24 TaxID=1986255 RepID=A0A2A5WRC6_9GAMM|nr:beta-ketoacyl-[acyl-carrier-protein] synthase II [Gammaproteobacteria bacterium]PDH39095.1 MAG: beta-ketoacyl-[acyl-carrier-protein] synthase II [OM182 bacterium MED-G24]RPG26374.1 MAG: beta-ketoacyl-[acyl-carrier-protein] synthase II [Gammaproteobacteria bacterium TMED50]